MTVSLTLHQTSAPSTVSGSASYSVTNEITASVGIAPEVFVFKTDTGVFDHYATPGDMDELTTSQAAAVVTGDGFYRQSVLTRVWPTISAMNDDLAMTRVRLNRLARDVSNIQGNLTIDLVTVITAG